MKNFPINTSPAKTLPITLAISLTVALFMLGPAVLVNAQAATPCLDGLDNDNDGYIDAYDPGCHTDWNGNNPASYDATIDSEYEVERIDFAADAGFSDDTVGEPSLSENGRLVVFEAYVPDDGSDTPDYGEKVFLYNRQTQTTKIINSGIDTSGNSGAHNAFIGNNGNSIIFTVYGQGVFIHDLSTNTNTLISKADQPADLLGRDSYQGYISNTGSFAVFTSYEPLLSKYAPYNYYQQVYSVIDGEVNDIISLGLGGSLGDEHSKGGAISDDGRFVSFISRATNLTSEPADGASFQVYLRDIDAGTVTKIDINDTTYYENSDRTSISADGRYVLFSAVVNSDDGGVFLYDRISNSTERVDVTATGDFGNGYSYIRSRSLSADGRFVVYTSSGDNLSTECGTAGQDTATSYIYDRTTNETACVVPRSAFANTYQTTISANGQFVAFVADYHAYVVPNPFLDGVVGYPTSDLPKLTLAAGVEYQNDPVSSGRGVYPNKGLANVDPLAFAVVYQQDSGVAPKQVSLVTQNEVNFNDEFYAQHLSIVDENIEFIDELALLYPELPAGRYLGYSTGLFEKNGFEGGETLVIGVPESTTQVLTSFALVPQVGVSHSIDLKLRALDGNQNPIAETTANFVVGASPSTAELTVSAAKPMSFLEISVPSSDDAQAFVQDITLTRTFSLNRTGTGTPDYAVGEQFGYSASFPKGKYTYYFTASSSDGQLAELKDDQSFTTGYSSVAFVPGIKASRLYVEDGTTDGNQLWEPNVGYDTQQLAMYFDGVTGKSAVTDIYTKTSAHEGLIDEANLLPLQPNYYLSFISDMNDMVTDGKIAAWEPLPYDWRLSYDDVLDGGKETDGRIYYDDLYSTSTPYILQELRNLVSTSDSGKISLVAHSTGGLLMKKLIYELEHSTESPYVENRDLLQHIDSLILVAVPQLGTPQAVSALLHGHRQGVPFDVIDIFTSREAARDLSEHMQSAFNLLPSSEYTNRVFDIDEEGNVLDNTALIKFSSTLADLDDPQFPYMEMLARYGSKITGSEELQAFLSGAEGRADSVTGDLVHPLKLNETMLGNAEYLHSQIDTWQPPTGMRVVQIAGWGIPKTVKGLEYVADTISVPCQPPFTGSCLGYKLDIQPIFTFDGDETVVVPSAVSMGEVSNSAQYLETYYVDLYDNNKGITIGRNHASILEVDSARTLIQNIIQTVTDPSAGLSYIKQDQAELQLDPADENKYIRLSMHSPVDVHIYDSEGNHVGISASSTSEVSLADEQIRNSYYLEFGEGKYLGVPLAAGDSYTVEFIGTGEGTFTFEMTEVLGDKELAAKTWSNVPVSDTTKATFTLTSVAATNELPLDQNGDGTVDQIVHFDIPDEEEPDEQLTIEEQLALLRTSIEGLNLKHGLAKVLLKNLDKAESYYQQKQYPRAILRLVLMEKTIQTLEKIKLIPATDAASILESLNTLQTEMRDLIPPPRPKDRR